MRILFQLQIDDIWKIVVFYSRKQILVERNYETHDQKLLIIVACFKHWRHYLKKNYRFIEILTNHNNLKKFMNV